MAKEEPDRRKFEKHKDKLPSEPTRYDKVSRVKVRKEDIDDVYSATNHQAEREKHMKKGKGGRA